MGTAIEKSERVSLRIDAESKTTLERAAAYTGSTLSDFVIANALAAANDVIQRRETIALSNRDWDAFFDALLDPPRPNAKLKRALKRHDERYG